MEQNKKLILIFPQEEWEIFEEKINNDESLCKSHKKLYKDLCYNCIYSAAIKNKLSKD